MSYKPTENFFILDPSRNCWKIAHAGRACILIDAASYFSAFYRAVQKARQSILITGWDIDSRLQLIRTEEKKDKYLTLGPLLDKQVRKNKGLEVHILNWDFAMIFAMEREPMPVFKLGWHTHKRVHFHMDDDHPIGASHHQKIVVIDDKLAFVGGLDLTQNRWDTPEHTPDDPLRKNPAGKSFGPFHDVQIMVDGDTAHELGNLVRGRWFRSTGKMLHPPAVSSHDPWPDDRKPEFHDLSLGISRTEPVYKARREVREVEHLYVDSITAAKEYIYLENQYLTSSAIKQALKESLQKPIGPEILIIIPRYATGWLEESTMSNIRNRLINELKKADTKDRLSIYHPFTSGGSYIKVHSKVTIIDDRFLRAGSSNLSNRSMGLDTECDLSLEAQGDDKKKDMIHWYKCRLLSEHLGVSADTFQKALSRSRSHYEAVESLRGKEDKTLVPFEVDEDLLKKIIPPSKMLDPERPVELDRMMDNFVMDGEQNNAISPWIKLAVILGLITLLGLVWRFTPLSEYVNVDTLTLFLDSVQNDSYTPFLVLGGFLLGSLLVFPITVLIALTGTIFEPIPAFLYSLSGSLLGATVTYFLGLLVGRDIIRRIAGGKLNKISKQLSKQGVFTVAIVRLVPIAPFTVINMVAGASHIRFWHFILGTFLGMAPGILGITVFAEQLKNTFLHPNWKNTAILVAIIIVLTLGAYFVKKRFTRPDGE